MPKIEFGDRDAANKIRSQPRIKGFLKSTDDRRSTTVELKEGTPQGVVQEVRGEAADTRRGEADKFGQVPLTSGEKKRLDFTETNVLKARSAKAIAVAKGVDDFTSYFDPTLRVDEHIDVFDRAAKEGGGRRGGRERADEREFTKRLAKGHQQVKEHQLPRAKEAGFAGDRGAQEFVRSQGSKGELFDIDFARTDSGLEGRGADFERLEDVQQSRSPRARTMDSKRQAPVTRDPFEWANNPNRLDFPGIDTVDPLELHNNRSQRSKSMDESMSAPIADSKEEWALAPDETDWPGVDTPGAGGSDLEGDLLEPVDDLDPLF